MAHRYDYQIDLTRDNAHARVIRLVGEHKRVLEVGCATGYMSRVLVEQFGCTVTGIEREPEAAEEARKACSRVIVGDLEALDYAAELGEERFDVIVCADVLEHLREPARVLATLGGFLAPGGHLVASIPNITHVAVIAELLEGRFPYGALGLLDETHVRFFTRDSIYDTFERAGFVVSHLERLRLEPEATEFKTDLSRFPDPLVSLLRAHDESTTYQFVLTAHPAPAGRRVDTLRLTLADTGLRATGGAPGDRDVAIAWPARPEGLDEPAGVWRERLAAVLEAILGRMTFLDADRDRRIRELETLRAEVAELRRTIAAHEGHVRHLQAEADRRQGHEAHIRHLEAEIVRRETRYRDEIAQELARRQTLYEEELLRREAQYDAVIDEEIARRRVLEHDVAQLDAHLADIKAGLGWKLLERFHRLRVRAVPAGSRRERLYRRLLSLARR